MSGHSVYNDIASDPSALEDHWSFPHDGEHNENDYDYALSNDGDRPQWISPLLTPESSSAPQAIPNFSLSNHVSSNIGYGFHSHTYGGLNHQSNPFDLAGITASPTDNPHSFDSSWQEPFVTQQHSFTSGFDSADSFGNSLSSFQTLDFGASVHAPMGMLRTDSGSSQEHAHVEDTGETFDDSQQLGTSCTVLSDIFQLDDVDANASFAKTKGRNKPLTDQARRDAALMRRLGACASCARRKIKCDPGIPCKRCVIYYGEELRLHPCRGDQLHGIAECMIKPNTFPRGGPERFIRDGNYTIGTTEYTIRLDLGFGSNVMNITCNPIISKDPSIPAKPLIHKHMSYPWPPQADASQRTTTDELVFPVKIADGQDLESIVDNYLTVLLRHENFLYFPLFRSQLNVLLGSYWLFKNLTKDQTQPLENALKLLILVHQGGDLRVRKDNSSLAALSQSYGGSAGSYENIVVIPCLVRSELGPIFSSIAHKLMRSVLQELEALSQVSEPSRFPLIMATFSVLCMALESLQYHISKLPYHCHHDDNRMASFLQPGVDEPPTRDLSEPGAEILIRFFKGTNCHKRLERLGTGARSGLTFSLSSLFAPSGANASTSVSRSRANSTGNRPRSGSGTSSRRTREASAFLDGLHNAVRESKQYLELKADAVVVPYHDMTSFFDRILARMYLLDPMSPT